MVCVYIQQDMCATFDWLRAEAKLPQASNLGYFFATTVLMTV